MVWIGDSLIQNLGNSRIWDSSFCLMHSVNFGISGDTTDNILWRLHNRELEDVAPKVILEIFHEKKHFNYIVIFY